MRFECDSPRVPGRILVGCAPSLTTAEQMSRPKKQQVNVSSQELRKTLEGDVQAFLKSGKKIEQVPTGFTNQDPLGGRRHIVLSPNKRR